VQAASERQALRYYRTLLRRYPRAPAADQARLGLAEVALDRQRVPEAMQLVQPLLRSPTPGVVLRAKLVLGRCHLARKADQTALPLLLEVAIHPQAGRRLRRDAQDAVAEVYLRTGRPRRAYRFFVTAAKGRADRARDLFVRLGDHYSEQKKHAAAAVVFDDAVRRWPKHPARCRWMARLFDHASINKPFAQQLKLMKRWVRVARSLSARVPRSSAAKTCRAKAAATLERLHRLHLERARKAQDLRLARQAKNAHRLVRSAFPTAAAGIHMLKAYADALAYIVRFKRRSPRRVRLYREVIAAYAAVALTPRPAGMTARDHARLTRNALKEAKLLRCDVDPRRCTR
jgi:tetratricopeptide (TPR) repeat protein